MCWHTLPTEYSYYGGQIANGCGARCVAIQECRQLLSLLKQRPLQPQSIAELREAQCGFEGRNPKVCCPKSPSLVVPPSSEGPQDTLSAQDKIPQAMTQPSSWESHPKAHLIPANECGIDNTQRIWGGNNTDLGQYPWAAILQYQTRKCSNEVTVSLCLVDRASFVNALFIFQLDTLLFSLYIYNFLLTIFFTCFGPDGPSSGESNYTCSLWHLSLVRCYLVCGRWC